jgi:integrase
MQAKISEIFVQKISTDEERLKVYDTLLKGLVLFVRPTGKKTWFVDYRKPDGKRTNHCIGSAQLFSVNEAREQARKFLSVVAKGEDPAAAPSDVPTFVEFLKNDYEKWVSEYRKSWESTMYMLKSNFDFLLDTPMDKITIDQVEQCRIKRKKSGLKSSSLNRRITALKAAINWAVKREIIENNPLSKLERLSERDIVTKVRYLSDEERKRLMTALDEREEGMRDARDSHNEWKTERKKKLSQRIKEETFADHLKPLVLLSLSTGVRRNGLLSLEWGDVNLNERTLLVRAATSKNERQYYVPLNDLAYETLSVWRRQSKRTSPGSLVFPSPQTGEIMDDCRTAWENLLQRAGIENFRWHDMRHDFASQLVMSGVDLNTVRELLGHADLKMTLRYAHLAPGNKMQAVKVLDKKRSERGEDQAETSAAMSVQ